MLKSLVFFLISFFMLFGCTSEHGKKIIEAKKVRDSEPEQALLILDRALSDANDSKDKLEIILEIEDIIKKKVKKADYYKGILKKKLVYVESDFDKNETLLTLSKLLIQNFKDNISALNYLEKIKIEALIEEQREQYFKSVLIAHINNNNYEQALIEVDGFLKMKDLSPSERFKIQMLKARTFADFKKVESAESEYKKLLNEYPNLSKKWKLRTQLALTLEGQKKYKEAISQLKAYAKENEDEDPLLDWRIQELEKRLAQQPGGKGRLRR